MLQGFRQSNRLSTLVFRKAATSWPGKNYPQLPAGPIVLKATYISVATLNPSLFNFVNQPISDISGLKHTKVHIHMNEAEVARTKLFFREAPDDISPPDDTYNLPFPERTRGYLYYQQHSRYPLVFGWLRFRVLPEGRDEFDDGEDLKIPTGSRRGKKGWKTWSRNVTRIHDSLPVVLEKLFQERLLLRNYRELRKNLRLSDIDKEPKEQRKPAGRPFTNQLYEKDDSFNLDVSSVQSSFTLIGQASMTMTTLVLWYLFRDRRMVYQSTMTHGLIPYQGLLSCRFELSTLPEHQGDNQHIVIRILDILKPVECLIPNYDGYINPPVPGELVSRGLPGKSQPLSIAFNSQRGQILRTLFSKDDNTVTDFTPYTEI